MVRVAPFSLTHSVDGCIVWNAHNTLLGSKRLVVCANFCIIRPTRVHNRNGKWVGSAVFAQLTTESAYTLKWASLSTRIAPSHRGSGPPM